MQYILIKYIIVAADQLNNLSFLAAKELKDTYKPRCSEVSSVEQVLLE